VGGGGIYPQRGKNIEKERNEEARGKKKGGTSCPRLRDTRKKRKIIKKETDFFLERTYERENSSEEENFCEKKG